MSFSSFDNGSDDVLSEINMVPLIDVMLVLLIVFIITAPVIQHAVSVDLPQAASPARRDKPQTIQLTIDAQGQYHWNQTPVSDEELARKLAEVAPMQPPPALHIRGDKAVRYERVAQAMAAAQRAGVTQLGFVTEP